MFDYLRGMLGAEGLPPHGYCLLWQPQLVWTHVVADLLIGIAYFSIPVVIASFMTQRRDVQFGWVVWMFAAFIMACGATHIFSIITLWNPIYGVEGLVKLVTAAVSVATAISLWPLLPRLIALPSPAQLRQANDQLQARVEERDLAYVALQREVEERARVEEMLRQAQKMEVVGQLTGGIAHDFNNLLTIVMANLERAGRMVDQDADLKRRIDSAMEGASRAATLTHQLLAFSRRQPLQPRPQDLSAVVRGMEDMLEQTLRETILVDLDLAEGLAPVLVDPVQTENAILNLAINARDAMPEGGRLRIATRDAGDHVLLLVSDTGKGMSDEVLAHAFEPFFTTKDVGEGSGLGLSQVYGFTMQSGGEIRLNSTPGQGTDVEILIPKAPLRTGADRDA
jgi:signal transduction histidine kinase